MEVESATVNEIYIYKTGTYNFFSSSNEPSYSHQVLSLCEVLGSKRVEISKQKNVPVGAQRCITLFLLLDTPLLTKELNRLSWNNPLSAFE